MSPSAPPGSDPGIDPNSDDGSDHVVVLLHGHGDEPASLAPVAAALSAALGKITQTPGAPHRAAAMPASANAGAAWWPDGEDAPHPSTIDALLQHAFGALEPPGPLTATLAGFSQGGAMALALAAALQRRHRTARVQVIVVAGFVPGGGDVLPHEADVLVVHGLDDHVVDPFHGELVARRCRRNGCRVTEIAHAGGHSWDGEVTRSVLAWLQGI